MLKKKPMPVMADMCATCPFRDDSMVAELRPYLIQRSLKEGRICHSTGGNRIAHKHPKGKSKICRGSRNFQLAFFHTIGFLDEATDEAWDRKLKKIHANRRVKK